MEKHIVAAQREKTVLWTVARKIMGQNFLSIQEVFKGFNICLTKRELKEVEEIPFSEELLRRHKDTHLLFLGVPNDGRMNYLTINHLREMFPAGQQPCFWLCSGSWHDKEDFSVIKTPGLRWYFIRKSIIKKSRSKTYDEQEKLLEIDEYREKAVVYVYMIFLMFKARGERLFEDDCVWCRDLSPYPFHNTHVRVGRFEQRGLEISWKWGSQYDEHLGLAPAKKFDSP